MRLRLGLIVLLFFLSGAIVAVLTMQARGPGVASDGGESRIGGPFSLTRQDGQRVTDADYRGRYMLVVFGFTYCPDICPAELQTVASALDKLPAAAAERVAPLFITIDPARDTPQHLGNYLKNFHPRMVGLTGSDEEIAQAAKAYVVYYRRVDDASASAYLMDHSAYIYLMSPSGKYLTHFKYGTSADTIAAKIASIMQQSPG